MLCFWYNRTSQELRRPCGTWVSWEDVIMGCLRHVTVHLTFSNSRKGSHTFSAAT
jgi:hypothetical protein